MVDIVFYSGVMLPSGEIQLTRRDEHIELNPAALQIEVVIHDKPALPLSWSKSDPTLTVFHEPDKDKK